MESRDPNRKLLSAKELAHSVLHLRCGFVGKGHSQNLIRPDIVLDYQISDASGENSSFAATSTRKD